MPVSYIPSAEQLVDRQKTTAKKRRRNQNAEIDELSKLLPVKTLPLSTPMFPEGGLEMTREASNGTKNQPVDKISVLRITSTFLKFQEFLKSGYFNSMDTDNTGDNTKGAGVASDLFAEAMDGFLIALDKEATILFASESITLYIGLTQHDVIGQCLDDITHPDDKEIIQDNLSPKATIPAGITNKSQDTQPRQFYIRFKSTMSPGRVQLSRFNSYTMVQVTGNLRVQIPESGSGVGRNDTKSVIGFVGECRLIESTASILEISIPQSYFTTTISMDMRIISVESQMKELIGFEAEQFVGTRIHDYFHPADYTKLIPCEVMLMHTGHAVSPLFRFMSSSGDWVWMQMEGILRYKPGTKERQFWEIKVKMVSQEEGHISLIEHSELYAPNSDPSQDLLNPHKDCKFLSKLNDSAHLCQTKDGSEPIIRSLASANVPQRVMDGVLHGRELGMQELPSNVKTVLHRNQADSFKVQLKKSLADGTWGLPDIVDPASVVMSPPLLPTNSSHSSQRYSPTPTVQSTLSSSFKSPVSTTLPSISRTSSDSIMAGQAPPVDLGNSDQHAIAYYYSSSSAASSPASTHISLHPPPTSDHAHSQLHNYADVRSPNNSYSAMSSPTSTGVVSSLSPSSSFMSSATSIQRPLKRKIAPGYDSAGKTDFSLAAPGVAITSMFGNTSTDFPPNFSEVPFQNTQVPVPSQPLPDQYSSSFHQSVLPSDVDKDSELSEILDHFHSVPNTTQTQNQNGDNSLQLISKLNPGEIQYYNSDSNSDHLISANHHMMTGDVTVSANQYMETGTTDQQNGTDIMEILSQFS